MFSWIILHESRTIIPSSGQKVYHTAQYISPFYSPEGQELPRLNTPRRDKKPSLEQDCPNQPWPNTKIVMFWHAHQIPLQCSRHVVYKWLSTYLNILACSIVSLPITEQYGKMSLFTVIWEAISPHHHSRTNGRSKWPSSFTTSSPLYHHCFISSSTAKLINGVKPSNYKLSSSSIWWFNNKPSPASMVYLHHQPIISMSCLPAVSKNNSSIFYTDIITRKI